MKLNAEINGFQQEVELTKNDGYVVDCDSDLRKVNRVLESVNRNYKSTYNWKYISNKPIFKGYEQGHYVSNNKDTVPLGIPIISFEDWEKLTKKKEPKPTKWRFKTKQEFDDMCKNKGGDYDCGNAQFIEEMFYLFGKEYAGSPDNLIKHDDWRITAEMLMPLEEVSDMIPNDPNCGEVKPTNSINSETKNYAFPVAPTQKWGKLTRGGYEYHIYEEFNGKLFGRIKWDNKIWIAVSWDLDGNINAGLENNFDLIPFNFNRESILKEIEDYENKIKDLKAKLWDNQN